MKSMCVCFFVFDQLNRWCLRIHFFGGVSCESVTEWVYLRTILHWEVFFRRTQTGLDEAGNWQSEEGKRFKDPQVV